MAVRADRHERSASEDEPVNHVRGVACDLPLHQAEEIRQAGSHLPVERSTILSPDIDLGNLADSAREFVEKRVFLCSRSSEV